MKKLSLFVGIFTALGYQTLAHASYSSECAGILSAHFSTITDAAFRACERVDNDYALACFRETDHLTTLSDGSVGALPQCRSQAAVNAIHELFTRFNTISDGAVWYLAGTYNPDAASCVDGLARFTTIDDAAFAACAR